MKCKTCGAEEGFIISRRVTGIVSELMNNDLSYPDEQPQMHDSICYGEAHKRLECQSCHGYYGNLNDVFTKEQIKCLG